MVSRFARESSPQQYGSVSSSARCSMKVYGRHLNAFLRGIQQPNTCAWRRVSVPQSVQWRDFSDLVGDALKEPDADLLSSLVCPFTKASGDGKYNLWRNIDNACTGQSSIVVGRCWACFVVFISSDVGIAEYVVRYFFCTATGCTSAPHCSCQRC